MDGDTVNVNIRVDKSLKEQADCLYAKLGMNISTAMIIFLRQSVQQGKIPFEITLNKPNAETLAAIREIEAMKSGILPKQSMSVEDFAREMGE